MVSIQILGLKYVLLSVLYGGMLASTTVHHHTSLCHKGYAFDTASAWLAMTHTTLKRCLSYCYHHMEGVWTHNERYQQCKSVSFKMGQEFGPCYASPLAVLTSIGMKADASMKICTYKAPSLFHYASPAGNYQILPADAEATCASLGNARLATWAEMENAYYVRRYHYCLFGYVSNGTDFCIKRPVQYDPNGSCGGVGLQEYCPHADPCNVYCVGNTANIPENDNRLAMPLI